MTANPDDEWAGVKTDRIRHNLHIAKIRLGQSEQMMKDDRAYIDNLEAELARRANTTPATQSPTPP